MKRCFNNKCDSYRSKKANKCEHMDDVTHCMGYVSYERIKEQIVQHCIKSKDIQRIYDNYIIKDIPFKVWVRNRVEWMLHETNEHEKMLDVQKTILEEI